MHICITLKDQKKKERSLRVSPKVSDGTAPHKTRVEKKSNGSSQPPPAQPSSSEGSKSKKAKSKTRKQKKAKPGNASSRGSPDKTVMAGVLLGLLSQLVPDFQDVVRKGQGSKSAD